MKKWHWVLVLLLVSGLARFPVAAAPVMDKLVLFGPDSAKNWSAAESTIEASTARTHEGKATLHWHVTVDHFAGEPNYPIGWPRITINIREASKRDWSDYDFLHFWIYTDTSRAKLPLEPVGLAVQSPDKESGFQRALSELRKGEWVEVKIPLTQLPRKDDVRSIQFHISESNYRHLDQLDFYMDELVLLRYAQPVLLNLMPESAVMFADSKGIPVSVEVAGVKGNAAVNIECSLSRRGQVLARTSVQAKRGPQRLVLNVDQAALEPGEYELAGQIEGAASGAKLRLVESPWKIK